MCGRIRDERRSTKDGKRHQAGRNAKERSGGEGRRKGLHFAPAAAAALPEGGFPGAAERPRGRGPALGRAVFRHRFLQHAAFVPEVAPVPRSRRPAHPRRETFRQPLDRLVLQLLPPVKRRRRRLPGGGHRAEERQPRPQHGVGPDGPPLRVPRDVASRLRVPSGVDRARAQGARAVAPRSSGVFRGLRRRVPASRPRAALRARGGGPRAALRASAHRRRDGKIPRLGLRRGRQGRRRGEGDRHFARLPVSRLRGHRRDGPRPALPGSLRVVSGLLPSRLHPGSAARVRQRHGTARSRLRGVLLDSVSGGRLCAARRRFRSFVASTCAGAMALCYMALTLVYALGGGALLLWRVAAPRRAEDFPTTQRQARQ